MAVQQRRSRIGREKFLASDVTSLKSKKGFFVFTPLHRQCPVDIVAISPKGKLHLFDVKTQSVRKSGIHKGHFIRRILSPLQKKLKVILNLFIG